jgi:hypothetical protein
MHAYKDKMHACNLHAHKVYAQKMHTYKTHAQKIEAYKLYCTPLTPKTILSDTPPYRTHASTRFYVTPI